MEMGEVGWGGEGRYSDAEEKLLTGSLRDNLLGHFFLLKFLISSGERELRPSNRSSITSCSD
jgi:hypothetical protein